MKTTAIMPAYQEEGRIFQSVAEVLPHVDEIVVVDDGSNDRSADEAKRAGALVLCHRLNRGQGAALKTGTLAALARQADLIVHIDADGQHDPNFLSTLLQPLKAGECDVVFGSRFLGVEAQGMPWLRRLLLKGARIFSSYILGIPYRVTDPQSGFRAMTAAAARQIPFSQDRMASCSEILRLVTHSPLRWREVPIRVRYNQDTLAKGVQTSDAFKIAWHLFLGSFQR